MVVNKRMTSVKQNKTGNSINEKSGMTKTVEEITYEEGQMDEQIVYE